MDPSSIHADSPTLATVASELGVSTRALHVLMVGILEGETATHDLEATVDRLVTQIDERVRKVVDVARREPAVSALESAWRAVFHLVDGTGTAQAVRVDLLNLSQAEFDAALDEGQAQEGGSLDAHLLRSPLAERVPYLLVLTLFEHGATLLELRRLQAMADLARRGGWVFASTASPRMFGLRGSVEYVRDALLRPPAGGVSLLVGASAEAWSTFRVSASSSHVVLLVGRVRLGRSRRAGGRARNVDGPWSSSVVLLADLVVRAFLHDGLAPGSETLIAGVVERLPARGRDDGAERVRHEPLGDASLGTALGEMGMSAWVDHRSGPHFPSLRTAARVARPDAQAAPRVRAAYFSNTLEAQLAFRLFALRVLHGALVRIDEGSERLSEWLSGRPFLERSSVRLVPLPRGPGRGLQLTLSPRARYMGSDFTLSAEGSIPE